MSISRGGAIGSSLLGVLGTRAQSNFHPMGGNTNRGGALAGGVVQGEDTNRNSGGTSASPLQGGFENRGASGNSQAHGGFSGT